MAGSIATSNRRRLDSWKEIAVFFGRDERTVNRWEKERGLPVHRLPGAKGRVYAYTDELSDWLAAPRNEAGLADDRTDPEVDSETVLGTPPAGKNETQTPRTHGTGWLVAAALLLISAVALILLRHLTPGLKSGQTRGNAANHPSRGSVQASSHAHNPEAEQLYLKGRYYWNKRTPDDLNKAVDYFMQAIVHDPNYAMAYVGLADCYNLLREYTVMPASEAYPRAFAAAKQAVELDDQSSAAHASLAFALFYGRWEVANAEVEFRRALDLDPNNAVAHHWYANYLLAARRLPESLAEIERAQSLDPASTSILADKGNILFHAGQRADAVTLLKQMEVTEPAFRSPHLYLKNFYLAEGDYPNFLAESKKDSGLVQDHAALAITTAAEKGFARGGAKTMFESMLPVQKRYYTLRLVSPVAVAQTYALLGNRQEALLYLKAAYDQHDELLLWIRSNPALDSLHDDPAYRDLLERMNLPVQN